jgi:hypothetical protein
MTHLTGYYVLLLGRGEGRPVAWFEAEGDALTWVNDHGSPTYPLDIKPAPLGESNL